MKQKPFVAISVVTDDIRPHEVRGRLIKIEMVKNHLDGKIEILSEFVNPERTMTMGMQIDKGIIKTTPARLINKPSTQNKSNVEEIKSLSPPINISTHTS